jgi:hypothetical protein
MAAASEPREDVNAGDLRAIAVRRRTADDRDWPWRGRGDRGSEPNENVREVRSSGEPGLPGAILVPGGVAAQVRGILILGR